MTQWQSARHWPMRTAVLSPRGEEHLTQHPTTLPSCASGRGLSPSAKNGSTSCNPGLSTSSDLGIIIFAHLLMNLLETTPAVYFFSLFPCQDLLTSSCEHRSHPRTLHKAVCSGSRFHTGSCTTERGFTLFEHLTKGYQPESQNGGCFFLEYTKAGMFFRTSYGFSGTPPSRRLWPPPVLSVDAGVADSATSML